MNIRNKVECNGCSCCAQKCPQQCISMLTDIEGFIYPQIDKDRCINCNLCEITCPNIHPLDTISLQQHYAVKHKDTLIQSKSSSGGVFSAIATYVIQQGGIVFGVKFENDWTAHHHYTQTLKGIEEFYGSKYIQSSTDYSYIETERFLKENKLVLYTGTPCQIAGLKKYLGKEYDNLLTMDFICHGVPSTRIWKQYLKETGLEEDRITNIFFRDKNKNGWKKYHFTIESSSNDSLSEIHYYNPFIKGFLHNLYLRPSCHCCKYKEYNSQSDFTMGDFWRVRKYYPKFYSKNGVSVLIANTSKAISLLPLLNIEYLSIDKEQVINSCPSITNVSQPHPSRNEFWEQIEKGLSLIELINNYIPSPSKYNLFFKDFIGNLIYQIRRL